MKQIYLNNYISELSQALKPEDTYAVVYSTEDIPFLDEGDYLYLTLSRKLSQSETLYEVVCCVGIDYNLRWLKIERGCFSTHPQYWPEGTTLDFQLNSENLRTGLAEYAKLGNCDSFMTGFKKGILAEPIPDTDDAALIYEFTSTFNSNLKG